MVGIDARVHRHHGEVRAGGVVRGNVVESPDVFDRGHRVALLAHVCGLDMGFDLVVRLDRNHPIVVGDGRLVVGFALHERRTPNVAEVVRLDDVAVFLFEELGRFAREDDAFVHWSHDSFFRPRRLNVVPDDRQKSRSEDCFHEEHPRHESVFVIIVPAAKSPRRWRCLVSAIATKPTR
jgi:hypothetical protein